MSGAMRGHSYNIELSRQRAIELCHQAIAVGLPEPVLEHRFHPERQWRFDIAWPEQQVAVEIEGGAWMFGRHNWPGGYVKDIEKYNWATLLGWKLFRVTPRMVKDGEALGLVERCFRGRGD